MQKKCFFLVSFFLLINFSDESQVCEFRLFTKENKDAYVIATNNNLNT